MKLLCALGLLAGGFLLVPKGALLALAVWLVWPALGTVLFGVLALLERWL